MIQQLPTMRRKLLQSQENQEQKDIEQFLSTYGIVCLSLIVIWSLCVCVHKYKEELRRRSALGKPQPQNSPEVEVTSV